MLKANDLSSFSFEKEYTLFSTSEVRVRYTTGRGDYYVALLECDDEVLSKTKFSIRQKIKDIKSLRDKVKSQHFHFRKNNSRIYKK